MVSSLMLIVVERRETFHYYYPMGVHPPGDLTVTAEMPIILMSGGNAMKKPYTSFVAGLLVGVALFGGATAHAAGIMAERSTHRVFVDGREVQMEAYVINGNNYVKLRDIGEQVGFNVYWDSDNGCVQVESGRPYTGEAPAKAEPDKPVPQPESTAPADVDAMKQDIVERTNALRKENGITALTTSDKLMQAAQVRADEMAANTVYSHTRPDGRNFNTVTDCPYMAENIHRIATRYLSQHDVSLAEAAVDGWANSETHLRNIRNERLNAIGVGIAKGVNAAGEESWYCVQLFLYDGCVISQVDTPITPK